MRATALTVTIVAATIAGNRVKYCCSICILGVVVKRPGTLQGCGSKVIRIARHRIAGCVANSAIDAFNGLAGFDPLSDDAKRDHADSLPLGRLGTPADMTGAFVFLASDEGRYYCGQMLHPNGGEIMP